MLGIWIGLLLGGMKWVEKGGIIIVESLVGDIWVKSLFGVKLVVEACDAMWGEREFMGMD